VARWAILEKGQPAYAVSVSCYPINDKNATAEMVADTLTAQLKKNLAIRHLKELTKKKLTVVGLPSEVRLLSYSLRGVDVFAARVFFLRELSPDGARVCYCVTAETTAETHQNLTVLLGKILPTVSLLPPKHPLDLPVQGYGEPQANYDAGYSFRAPKGWYVAGNRAGTVDYIDKAPMEVMVSVQAAKAGSSSESCARQEIDVLMKKAEETKAESRVLSEGSGFLLGGKPAYQFVIQNASKAAAGGAAASQVHDSTVLLVQRTIYVERPAVAASPATTATSAPTAGATLPPPRAYLLTLVCPQESATKESAVALMEQVAKGFELASSGGGASSLPSSQPASAPSRASDGTP
jgi:hypothetical protein